MLPGLSFLPNFERSDFNSFCFTLELVTLSKVLSLLIGKSAIAPPYLQLSHDLSEKLCNASQIW